MLFLFKVVERRKQIEIEEQEIKRKEKELIATVKIKLIKCIPALKAWSIISSMRSGLYGSGTSEARVREMKPFCWQRISD